MKIRPVEAHRETERHTWRSW